MVSSYPVNILALKTPMVIEYKFWTKTIGSNFWNEKMEPNFGLQKQHHMMMNILKVIKFTQDNHADIINIYYIKSFNDPRTQNGNVLRSTYIPWQYNVFKKLAPTTSMRDFMKDVVYTLSASSPAAAECLQTKTLTE